MLDLHEKQQLVNAIAARLVKDDEWGGRHTQHQISLYLSVRGVDVNRTLPPGVDSRRKRIQLLLLGGPESVVLSIADELGIPHTPVVPLRPALRLLRITVVAVGFCLLLLVSIAASFWILNRTFLSAWLTSAAYPGMTIAGFIGSGLPGVVVSAGIFVFGRQPIRRWINGESSRPRVVARAGEA